jgi:hypothetical protein
MHYTFNLRGRELEFFTETIGGQVYGGWYRLLRTGSVEVLSIGLMTQVPLTADTVPETLARDVLRRFIDARVRAGDPVPSLGPGVEERTGTLPSSPRKRKRRPPRSPLSNVALVNNAANR